MTPQKPAAVLDLRKTKCPLNFVQARLALEKLTAGEILEIYLLTEGESAINVPDSLIREGHQLLETVASHKNTPSSCLILRFLKRS